jgi:hypothetical protein
MAKPIAPRFSRSFRRLCQVAALAGSDRLQRVIDGLLPAIMVWDDKKAYKVAADWVNEAREEFGLPLEERDVAAAFDRAITAGNLVYNPQQQVYEISADLRNITLKRIKEAEELEVSAQSAWLEEVGSLVPDIPSDDLWNCLITYAGEMFLHHGYEAVALLSNEVETDDGSDDSELSFTSAEALYKAMKVANIDRTRISEVTVAIAIFFDSANSERVKYVTELADSTFNFMALGVDEDTRGILVEHLPNLTIFVDTNVIFDIVGAGETPLAASSLELFEIIKHQNLTSLRLYCHEKTLQELERTLEGIGSWLRRTRWTPSTSQAILNASPDISSIELKYHQTNAKVPTSPDVFLGRYSSMQALLDQHGIKIYRDQGASTLESVRTRGELAAEYEAFIEKHRGRKRPYEALDHDVTVWLAGISRRIRTGKGPIFSGALFLSADNMFARFERVVLMRIAASGARIVTQPSSLLQALRPFLPMPEDYDAAFVQLFSISPFRIITPGLGQTINTVASYLATYEGLPEEIATNILTNSILMSRLKNIDRNDAEFQRVVGGAVVDESRNILRERDQLLEDRHQAAENAKDIIEELSAIAGGLQETARVSGTTGVDEVAQRLRQVEEKIASGLPDVSVHIEGNAYGLRVAGIEQTVTVNLAAELPAVKEFVEEFRAQLDQLSLSPEQLEDVTADLEVAEAQLQSPKPRPAILGAAVNSLREVTFATAGSGAWVGLVELAQHIHL